MKRLFIIIALAALLCPLTAEAQQKVKFGHVDYGEIIKIMPGIDTVQKVIADMQAELQATGEEMAKEFQKKQEEYQQLGSKGASAAVIKMRPSRFMPTCLRIWNTRISCAVRWRTSKTFSASATLTVFTSVK